MPQKSLQEPYLLECGDNILKQESVANIMFSRLKKRNSFLSPGQMGAHDPSRKKRTLGIREARRKSRHFQVSKQKKCSAKNPFFVLPSFSRDNKM